MGKPDSEIVYIAQLKGSLELTSEGQWIHNGIQFQNEKLSELFSRSIVWNEITNEYLVEIGNQRATFTCHDTAFFVRAINDTTNPWMLTISDGTQEPLQPETLTLGPNNNVYCTVHKIHRAKLLKSSHQTLAAHVTDDSSVVINGKRVVLSP